MAKLIHPLAKIAPLHECWRVKVRIIRLWTLPSFSDPLTINSIEMVFMDEFGCTIHASVRKNLVNMFKSQLKEGYVYIFAYFGVGENTCYFRTTRHEFRLNFQPRTTVTESNSDAIPQYGCKFVSLDDILKSNPNCPYLVDTMGMLTAVGNVRELDKGGKKTKMIVIQLEVEGVKLDVALFGEFACMVTDFMANGVAEQVVVVIQFARVKTFQGKIVLQNVMHGTRLLFNPDMQEVSAFKNSVLAASSESRPVSLLCGAQSYSFENDFLNSTPSKMIGELKDCKEDGFYIVYATVVAVTNDEDWWYIACKCNKAVTPHSGMYYCKSCSCHVMNVTSRYRIKMYVMDDSGSTVFVLFDREASYILNMPCSLLLEKTETDHKHTVEHPKEFEEYLIQKKFLFKVEVKTGFKSHLEPSFKVSKICHDTQVISKFLDMVRTNSQKPIAEISNPYYSLEDDFLKVTPRKTIEELKDCKEDGDYAVYATIKGVDGGPNWFIAACRCGTEVVPQSGSYYCDKCKKRVVNVIPRYKIKARVIDASDSATFVIFEKLGCLLLHKSCTEMLKSTENDGLNLSQPLAFQQMLIDRSFIFKVEVKSSCFNELEPSYDVLDICFDEQIITQFKDLNPTFFSAQTDLTAGISFSEKTLNLDLRDVRCSSSSSSSSSYVKDLMKEFDQSESGAPLLTPAKRLSSEMHVRPDGKMSTNKLKSIKIEKE